MQPLRMYEYLERSRQPVLDAVRSLNDQQRASEFPIGPGSLVRTITHIMVSEWFYIQRILQTEVPPYEKWSIREEVPPKFSELEAAWIKQAAETRSAISSVRDWDAPIEYPSLGGEPMIVTTCAADIFAQLVLHEVHHRAQVLNMLRQLGVELGDLDYNALMYDRRPA